MAIYQDLAMLASGLFLQPTKKYLHTQTLLNITLNIKLSQSIKIQLSFPVLSPSRATLYLL